MSCPSRRWPRAGLCRDRAATRTGRRAGAQLGVWIGPCRRCRVREDRPSEAFPLLDLEERVPEPAGQPPEPVVLVHGPSRPVLIVPRRRLAQGVQGGPGPEDQDMGRIPVLTGRAVLGPPCFQAVLAGVPSLPAGLGPGGRGLAAEGERLA